MRKATFRPGEIQANPLLCKGSRRSRPAAIVDTLTPEKIATWQKQYNRERKERAERRRRRCNAFWSVVVALLVGAVVWAGIWLCGGG